MSVYWLLFLWPALAAVSGGPVPRRNSTVALTAFALLLTIIIGLRFEVGADWESYLAILTDAEGISWFEAISSVEPTYRLLNWIALETGTGIWLVNIGCAIPFVSGLFAFVSRLPNRWLALTVAVPYMIIVLGMGYTRQAAALGIVMWGLTALMDGRIRRFVLLIVLAATFHKATVIMMPLAAFASARNPWWTAFWIALASFLAYVLFLLEYQESIVQGYLGIKQQSEGGGVRVVMNATAAVLILSLHRRFGLTSTAQRLWNWIAVACLLFIPAILLSPSSSAVDRVALYFMPVQLFTFSHLPIVLRQWRLGRLGLLLVVGAYAIVLAIWIFFSPFSSYWIPYRMFSFPNL